LGGGGGECGGYLFLHLLLKTTVALFSAHMSHKSDDSQRHFILRNCWIQMMEFMMGQICLRKVQQR